MLVVFSLAKGAGWDMRGTDCGQSRTWGEV